ncbi:MAG: flagellar motor switch protein FliG, partial [Paenibacillus sp.]|nr:flagellar motor switch protein FliG [Paenibacillus sp.]
MNRMPKSKRKLQQVDVTDEVTVSSPAPEVPRASTVTHQPSRPSRQLTTQQKAAAVIISLGADKASQIYQNMDPEDVERLTLEVAQLGFL